MFTFIALMIAPALAGRGNTQPTADHADLEALALEQLYEDTRAMLPQLDRCLQDEEYVELSVSLPEQQRFTLPSFGDREEDEVRRCLSEVLDDFPAPSDVPRPLYFHIVRDHGDWSLQPTLSLTPAQFKRTVSSQTDAIGVCFRQGWDADHRMRGQVTVKSSITAQGDVARTEVLVSSLESPMTDACIESILSELEYPQSKGRGLAEFVYTLYYFEGHGLLSDEQPSWRAAEGYPATITPGPWTAERAEVLDRAAVDEVLDAAQAGLHTCYERGLRDAPRAGGHLELELTLGPDGQVTDARVASSELDMPGLEACLQDQSAWLSFPAPSDEAPLTLHYPMTLAPPPQQALVNKALIRGQLRARDCYETNVAGDKHLAGILDIELEVAPTGRVSELRFLSNTLQDERTEKCVQRRLTKLKFPPHGGTEPMLHRVPMELLPSSPVAMHPKVAPQAQACMDDWAATQTGNLPERVLFATPLARHKVTRVHVVTPEATALEPCLNEVLRGRRALRSTHAGVLVHALTATQP